MPMTSCLLRNGSLSMTRCSLCSKEPLVIHAHSCSLIRPTQIFFTKQVQTVFVDKYKTFMTITFYKYNLLDSYTSVSADILVGETSRRRWVGIKESGRPKPALLDSGRPRTGVVLVQDSCRRALYYQPFARKEFIQFHVFVHVIYIGTSYYYSI